MRRWMAACALLLAAHAAWADDLVLRDMGGVPAHVDLNGTYMAGQILGPSSVGDLSGESATIHDRQRHSAVLAPRLEAVSPAGILSMYQSA